MIRGTRLRRSLAHAAVLACLLISSFAAVGTAHAESEPKRALTPAQKQDVERVLKRYRAPCCWNEALETHQSPEADRLRREIVGRIHGGEDVAVIEDELLERYGQRILTVPKSGGDQNAVFGLMLGGFAASLALLFFIGRRLRAGRAGGASKESSAASEASDDELDRRIEAGLEELDD